MPGGRLPYERTRRRTARGVTIGALLLLTACTADRSGGGTAAGTASTIASGSPWMGALTTDPLPAPIHVLRAVSCASAARCWAVGSTLGTGGAPNGAAVVATTDGGALWTLEAVPTSVGYLTDISCGDVHHCEAVGQSGQTGTGPGVVIETGDGGSTWTIQTIPAGTTEVDTVTCSTDLHCVAIARAGGPPEALVSVRSGAPFVVAGVLPVGATAATALACTSDSDCWATVDGTGPAGSTGSVVATADGAATWSPVPTPTGIGELNGIACEVRPTTPGSAHPAARSAPPGSAGGTTTTVSAGAAGVAGVGCVAVGTTSTTVNAARTGRGVVLTTTDGGGAWSLAPVSAVPADLLSVSCITGPCVAVGTSAVSDPLAGVVLLTPGTGTTATAWHRAAVVPVALPLAGVSCVSLSACVAVGESISAHLEGG